MLSDGLRDLSGDSGFELRPITHDVIVWLCAIRVMSGQHGRDLSVELWLQGRPASVRTRDGVGGGLMTLPDRHDRLQDDGHGSLAFRTPNRQVDGRDRVQRRNL